MGDQIVHTTQSDVPDGVAVKEMTAEQQAAYWRQRSRQHESRSGRWNDVDAVRARLAELEGGGLTEAEEAQQHAENEQWERDVAARTEQRRSEIALTVAAATGRTGVDLAVIVDRLDPNTFADEHGEIDGAALADFVSLIGRTTTR